MIANETSQFVSEHAIKQAGYQDCESAAKIFYDRAEVSARPQSEAKKPELEEEY